MQKGGETLASHFITGFPGFVATEMIHALFKQKQTTEIFAVVLASKLAKAKVVVQEIEQQYEGCQIVLFEGDITLPNLDLQGEEFRLIAPKIEVVWHLAAAHQLSIKREQAWKVNVHGTANVNEFVCRLPNLRRYMYFSMAFISGKRNGTILETELIRPPAFHNHLEETKFEAELLVDDLKLELPVTILRPVCIYGNSQTKGTEQFNGLYYLMHLINDWQEKVVFPQLGSKQTDLHVVSLQYVIEASIRLCMNPQAEGETVHLIDATLYPVATVYQELASLLTKRKTFGTLPLGIAKVMLEQKNIRNGWQVPPQLIDYLDLDAHFDTTDCIKLVGTLQEPQQDVLQALPKLVQFYREHKHLQSFYVEV